MLESIVALRFSNPYNILNEGKHLKTVYKSFGFQFSDQQLFPISKNIYAKLEGMLQSGSPYWIHFQSPSNKVIQFLNKQLDIPKEARLVLFAKEARPRSLKIGENLFLSVQDIKSNNIHTESDFPSLRIWVCKNGLLTLSTEKVDAISDALKELCGESELSSLFCVQTLLNHLFAYLEETIHELDDKLYQTESHFSYDENMASTILLIRQDIIYLRRYVFPQRDALINFTNKLSSADENTKAVFKALSENMVRYSDSIDTIRERARLLQDHITTKINELINRRIYVLTIIMLIFTPAFFIMNLFSMYLPTPGMDSTRTWWIVCALIVLVSAVFYLSLKRKKWI